MVRALLCLCGALAPAIASAEPRTENGLVWAAPDACPGAAEVRARIESRLRLPLAAVHGIEVDIAVDGATYVARIDLRGVTLANDVRIVRSTHCDELTDAVAVIVARATAEQRSFIGLNDVVPEGHISAATVPTAPPPAVDPPWGVGLSALYVTGIGALPHVNTGEELGLYVRRESGFFELTGARWQGGSSQLHPGAPARVGVDLYSGELRFGWRPPNLPIRAWGGAEIGEMSGAGMALENPQAGTATWAAVDVGFGVAWPITKMLRIVGVAELAAVFVRPQFILGNGTTAYEPAPVAVRSSFGVEVGWR
ncbi:MAG TPA: hypothetical protein VGM88_09480 [Kofleriaceae bacterium]